MLKRRIATKLKSVLHFGQHRRDSRSVEQEWTHEFRVFIYPIAVENAESILCTDFNGLQWMDNVIRVSVERCSGGRLTWPNQFVITSTVRLKKLKYSDAFIPRKERLKLLCGRRFNSCPYCVLDLAGLCKSDSPFEISMTMPLENTRKGLLKLAVSSIPSTESEKNQASFPPTPQPHPSLQAYSIDFLGEKLSIFHSTVKSGALSARRSGLTALRSLFTGASFSRNGNSSARLSPKRPAEQVQASSGASEGWDVTGSKEDESRARRHFKRFVLDLKNRRFTDGEKHHYELENEQVEVNQHSAVRYSNTNHLQDTRCALSDTGECSGPWNRKGLLDNDNCIHLPCKPFCEPPMAARVERVSSTAVELDIAPCLEAEGSRAEPEPQTASIRRWEGRPACRPCS
mmetsp:Transcript_42734/g.101457  ORF Transcript_42734/g.101457 Transcript_42734/m.101457 type:complete len:401 (+) Transcript_42734:111-1313(+)